MVAEIERFESPDGIVLGFCSWCWMKSEVCTRNVDTRDGLLTRSLNAAARVKKGEDELRRKTRELAHDLQSALSLTLGYSKSYCEL